MRRRADTSERHAMLVHPGICDRCGTSAALQLVELHGNQFPEHALGAQATLAQQTGACFNGPRGAHRCRIVEGSPR